MKVILTTSHFYPSLGGIENHCLNIGKRLVQRGHEVLVASTTLEGLRATRNYRRFSLNGIQVRRFIPFPFLVPFFAPGRWSTSFAPGMPFFLMKKSLESDLIHAHGFGFFPTDLSAWVCKIRNKPLIITLHGFHPDYLAFMKNITAVQEMHLMPYFKATALRSLTIADAIIALTPHEKDILRTYYHVSEEKITIIPNGIDFQSYLRTHNKTAFKKRFNLKENVILFVGAIRQEKGLHYLLHAIPSILKEFPQTSFVFIGKDWGFKKTLLQEGKRIGVVTSIHFLGSVKTSLLREALGCCDVFVNPSAYESFGISLLEAMASGKPTVATNVGGIPYIVRNGKTGIIVKHGDSESLATAIKELLGSAELRTQMGEKGLQLAKNYDWEEIVLQIEQLYDKVLTNY
ncbi:MAG: glycosyltransferase family 4 protein [Promethearchaeota archaeon]